MTESDWETDELVRWLVNDEGVYREARLVDAIDERNGDEHTYLEAWVRDLLPHWGDLSQALSVPELDEVDWEEVAACIRT